MASNLTVTTALPPRGRALADARLRGVRTLVAEVLATNHLMLEVFTDAGTTLSREDGEVRVTLPTWNQKPDTAALDSVQPAR